MIAAYSLLLFAATVQQVARAQTAADTIRLEVGSPQVDGRVYRPHAARVRVRVGDDPRVVAEWTNELTLGDSAGRPVMRWVTKGTRFPPSGAPISWEIRQTYDAVTLAPYDYVASSSTGGFSRLKLDGRRVTGARRLAADSAEQQVDVMLDRPGFVASASDLVPLAVGLEEGRVMTAPVWGPAMSRSELRVFTVVGRGPVSVEGSEVVAWKVEERRQGDGRLVATWYLTESSPYMVYGEVPLPNGQVQRMTEVAIAPPSGPPAARDTARRGYAEGDVRFMQQMIAHHAQALAMTALVPTRSTRAEMRLLAERIEVSQHDEIAQMRRWLTSRGEQAPSGDPQHAQHAMGHESMPGMLTEAEMAELARASGTEFDRLFLRYMIRHHEGAITMVRQLFGTPGAGQESQVYSVASDVEADQRAEIARMRTLLAGLPAR